MKISAFAATAALGVVLSGCAGTVWDKPGATQQDFAKDSYECERDMRQSGYYGGGIMGVLNAQDFEKRCMNARGWFERSASNPPTTPVSAEQHAALAADPATMASDNVATTAPAAYQSFSQYQTSGAKKH